MGKLSRKKKLHIFVSFLLQIFWIQNNTPQGEWQCWYCVVAALVLYWYCIGPCAWIYFFCKARHSKSLFLVRFIMDWKSADVEVFPIDKSKPKLEFVGLSQTCMFDFPTFSDKLPSVKLTSANIEAVFITHVKYFIAKAIVEFLCNSFIFFRTVYAAITRDNLFSPLLRWSWNWCCWTVMKS